ncbi:Putative ribonuclease H protein At1g65750 [Linum perenne]
MKGPLGARCGDGLYIPTLFSGDTVSLIRGVGCVIFGLIIGFGGVRLSVSFPRIAAAAQSSTSCVYELCPAFTGTAWHIPLVTTLRGGAILELHALLDLLESLPDDYISTGPASVVWPLESSGNFTVGSLKRFFTKERYAPLHDFPSDVIWEKAVPSKIQCFMWMVWHGKIASIDNLQQRGMVLTNWCALCERDAESVDHLLVHCPFLLNVWSEVSSKLSLFGPRNGRARDWIGAWKGMNCVSSFAVVSRVILHGVLWYVWLERNARVFSDTKKGERQVAARALWNCGRWLYAEGSFSSADLERWNLFIFYPG